MTAYNVSSAREPLVQLTSVAAVVHDRYGRPDEMLRVGSAEVGAPAAGEVLVEVVGSSLNPLDWHFATGTPWMLRLVGGLRSPKQRVRGRDLAGRVRAVGAGVDEFAVGDLVFGGADGAFAELAIARPHNLAHVPDGCSLLAAAALPIAAATALQAVDQHAGIEAGQRVLINGAAGGVGTMAVQIAVTRGAEVTAICSGRNVEMVRRLGAATVIDYTSTDALAGARAAGPFDVVLDGVGNWSSRHLKSLLTPTGVVVAWSGPKRNPLLGPFPSMLRTQVAFAIGQRRFVHFTAAMKDAMAPIAALVASGELVPEVGRTIGLDDVPAALTELGAGHTPSKVVVRIGAE